MKTVKAVPAKKDITKKPAAKKEDGIKKLSRTSILKDFVVKNNGCWDHQGWLVLCEKITAKGFGSIDFDQVGVLLEQEKTAYHSKK